MKRIMLLAVLLLTGLLGNATQIFTITGKLDGLPDGAKIVLTPGALHKKMEPVATAITKNGEFKLTYKIDDPRFFALRADGISGVVMLVIEPGENITLNGSLKKPVIIGSRTNEKFIASYTQPRAEFTAAYNAARIKYATVSKRLAEARAKKDQATITEIEASKEWKDYNDETKLEFAKFDELMLKLATENRSSYWGPLLLFMHTAYFTPEFEKYYNIFSADVKKGFYGRQFAEDLYGVIGKAPNFTAIDAQGNQKSLTDLLSGKNYVLLDFWASWCVPCRKFLPTLKDLAKKYGDKGLIVVSISIDEKKDAWLTALEEEKMPWLNLLDTSKLSKTYGVSAIPSVFLIDPQGKIVFGKQSGDLLIKKLEETFGAGK